MQRTYPIPFSASGNPFRALLFAIIILYNLPVSAAVYSVRQKGSYDQQEIWIPRYPGNVIKETDTVVINNEIYQNVDIVVRGTLIIRENSSFRGNKNMIVVKSGTLLNLGDCRFELLTNRGAIYNENTLEVSLDFVNSGNVINYKKIDVSNVLDNTGMITGKEGKVSASRKFINSRTGIIKGYVDVCSNNFMNVEGGSIDTQTTTFCGNQILNANTMVSQQGDPFRFEKKISTESIFQAGEPPRN